MGIGSQPCCCESTSDHALVYFIKTYSTVGWTGINPNAYEPDWDLFWRINDLPRTIGFTETYRYQQPVRVDDGAIAVSIDAPPQFDVSQWLTPGVPGWVMGDLPTPFYGGSCMPDPMPASPIPNNPFDNPTFPGIYDNLGFGSALSGEGMLLTTGRSHRYTIWTQQSNLPPGDIAFPPTFYQEFLYVENLIRFPDIGPQPSQAVIDYFTLAVEVKFKPGDTPTLYLLPPRIVSFPDPGTSRIAIQNTDPAVTLFDTGNGAHAYSDYESQVHCWWPNAGFPLPDNAPFQQQGTITRKCWPGVVW